MSMKTCTCEKPTSLGDDFCDSCALPLPQEQGKTCDKCDCSEISIVRCGNKDCKCHKVEAATFDANKRMGELHDEIAGWEKRFDREFNTLSEMPQGDYVKSFIRTVEQEAYERGREKGFHEGHEDAVSVERTRIESLIGDYIKDNRENIERFDRYVLDNLLEAIKGKQV